MKKIDFSRKSIFIVLRNIKLGGTNWDNALTQRVFYIAQNLKKICTGY